MRSSHLTKFNIPDVEYEASVSHDTHGVPNLMLRHTGSPLFGLDLTQMSQLKQWMEQDGDTTGAEEIGGYIEKAKALGLGEPAIKK